MHPYINTDEPNNILSCLVQNGLINVPVESVSTQSSVCYTNCEYFLQSCHIFASRIKQVWCVGHLEQDGARDISQQAN